MLDWPWFLGAGVALVVGVIAFAIAGGLVDGETREDGRPTHRPSGIRRAS